MNIYVGNIPLTTTGDDLKSMFSEFGEVQEAKVITDGRTRQSKGFGFVDMPSNSEADQAIKNLNGKFIDGRNIKVNPADSGRKKKTKRSRHRRR
ncbi:MAG: RNA recognition motif domain-containing protein [Desulfobacterales bacterium]